MNHEKTVWVYARSQGTAARAARQRDALIESAKQQGYVVAGSSMDSGGPYLLIRPGLRECLRHLKTGTAAFLYVERMGRISHSERFLYWFFSQLEDCGVRVIAQQYQLPYRMFRFRLGQRLERRTKRHGLAFPW